MLTIKNAINSAIILLFIASYVIVYYKGVSVEKNKHEQAIVQQQLAHAEYIKQLEVEKKAQQREYLANEQTIKAKNKQRVRYVIKNINNDCTIDSDSMHNTNQAIKAINSDT